MTRKKTPQVEKDNPMGKENLQLLFTSHPMPMFVYHMKTLRFLEVNDAALKKYGYTRDEFLGLSLNDLYVSELEGVQRHHLKNGQIIEMEVVSQPFEIGGEKVSLITAQDITLRRQAEEKLRESMEMLNITLENIADPLFITDEAGQFVFICPNVSNGLYFSVQEIEELGNVTALIGGDIPESNETVSTTVEREIVDKKGDRHIFRIIKKRIRIGKGAYLYTMHNIANDKRTEAELVENKITAERYLNIVAEIIVSLDNEGNITHLNESGYRLLGYEGGLVGKNWFETCLPEEQREETRRFFGMLRDGNMPILETRENEVITRAGEKRVILWHNTVLTDPNGQFMGTLSSGEDITERIEMEKALRIALAKYKTLFECFPLGITIADKGGNILETNPTAEKLLSVPREEHTNRSIDGAEWRIIRPDGTPMPAEEYASMRALQEDRLVENVEMGIVKPDSSVIWLTVNASPLPPEGHSVVITYGDITNRKKTENLLQARLKLSLFSDTHTLDELLQKTLDEAESLTGSEIGFAHFLQADQKTLELQTWSTNTLKNMCAAEGKGQHYPVEQAGVWVECVYTRAPVIHNDYAGLPDSRRKGLPPGHAPVIRELVVPIMRGDLIVAIFGVGNKPTNYTSEDVDVVLELANLSWDIIQRKRSEEALKDSERKYRMLHESMMDGFVRVDMDGHIVEHNHVYADMLGYSESELTSLTYKDITPQKWHEAEDQIVQSQILKRGYSDIYEKEYRRKDGSIFPVELRAILLRNEYWKPTGIWAIVRDITQRKQTEEALRESEARFRTALQEVQTIAVQGYAEDGTVQYWNKTSENLYGYSAQEAIGQNLLLLIIPPEMREDVRLAIQKMVETGQPRAMEELSLMRKDGSRVSVYSSHVVVQSPGRPTELFCLDLDLTERKQAEEALRESEWRNRIVSELTTDYIFVVDVEHSGTIKLKWASDNMARITGRTVEDAATSDLWAEIIHPDDREKFFDFVHQVISTATTGELECRTFYKNGEERWIHIFAWPQAGEVDKVMTIVGAIDDVTERRRAEEALETKNVELQAALEREKELSHTDMLTGVNNRRYLYELIVREFEIAIRYHQPLSLMMFDLDHFKKVNDTFGHIVGDQILARVTKAACAELRSADAIGRYGGEEFIILLPITTAQQAYSLAERIRENAAQIRVSTPIGEASVTISIGIVEMKHGVGPDNSVDDLIRRADKAMYAAKQGGRNCVVIAK